MVDHVQITNTPPRVQYVSDGSSTPYAFSFAVFKAENLQVYFDDKLQEATNYAVTISANGGGTLTFTTAPDDGVVVTICRKLNIERISDFQEGSVLRAKVLNDELDYQTACLQELADNINRSMVLPPYAANTNVDLTLPTPQAGKAIVWNSAGTNLENSNVEVNNLESTLEEYKNTAQEKAELATTKAAAATESANAAAESANAASTAAQTAQAATSSKANIAADNFSAVGKSALAGFSMPSGEYEDLTFAYDQDYDALANGWVVLHKKATATGQWLQLINKIVGEECVIMAMIYQSQLATQESSLWIPVAKGSKFRVQGNFAGTVVRFAFVKAQGEQ